MERGVGWLSLGSVSDVDFSGLLVVVEQIRITFFYKIRSLLFTQAK